MTARSTARPAPSSTPPDLVLLTGGPRLVLLLLIAAVTALTTVVPVPAQAMPPRSVEVIDTLDAVDAPALTEELDEVGFRSEVDLRVLVLDVTAQGRSASDDRALNDAVLLYARDSRPDLLSEDGDHWADGTVILALDPGNRFLGTYAGEDVKLTDGGFEAVQEDMRDEAQDGGWEATILAGAEEYADRLDRPAWQHPLALLVIIAVPAALIIVLVSLLVARGQARALVDRARETVTAVRGARAVTDRAARELEEAARRLDELDDVVVETRDLLQRGDWRALWERELAPFRAGFEALPDALELDAEATDGEREAAEELRRVAGEVEDELPGLTADLKARRITPAGGAGPAGCAHGTPVHRGSTVPGPGRGPTRRRRGGDGAAARRRRLHRGPGVRHPSRGPPPPPGLRFGDEQRRVAHQPGAVALRLAHLGA